jgi:hypothetical protein
MRWRSSAVTTIHLGERSMTVRVAQVALTQQLHDHAHVTKRIGRK